ncbi:dynein axonemal heavy chain 17 isoform X7 [Pteropus medius]|uniref:dynein heavy chain 17, axonemal isoform X7 n=1 Tax=Pteropus vampyrus TaxID=132908 RepID=UPI00196A2FFF|nr:dynein heavy chain 17, axonemal isoform X7 [Pteropus giganteus]
MTVTPDVRLEYLEGVAFTMLKFKPDKWGKMMSVEENLALFTDFLEKPDTLVLVLTLTPAGMIVPCLGFPASLKSKGVYFVKKKPRSISKDSYKDHLLYGDLSPTPVDQLIAVVEEVLYSLLNQSENLNGWPWVVSEDIMKQVHKLKNEMFVMGGKIKGKTLLPIPEHLGSLDGTLESMERIPSALDNSLLHAIETIIIDWAHQVRDVLSKDSAQALLDGLQPLPRVEFEFWDARLMNLKCIHDQLNRPKVNKIVEILEKAKSCYWPALQNVYLNVTEGLKEANDIVLYLMPLRILLEEMEQADFTMLPTFITKVLYTICFIWATSEHYNTPSRVIVTLQEFCNQIIEMTRTYLSPEEVLKGLQGEIEEVLNNISLSVNILKELYRAYDFCCANMRLFFKKEKEPVPWEFPSSLAFSRMNAFFRRVRTIEDLYKTAIEFLKLEKIELGGARGNILGSLVMHIYEEVFELVKVFADCKYDPLDPGDPSFDDDYADFETKIQDLDRRLATIFCQAFDDCNSIESCAKLLYMCGGLLERPLILAEVVPRYSVMLELFDAELDNTKILYDTQIAASADGNIPPIHKNMPPVAGQLKWSLELQERLETPMKDLKRIDHPVMSSTEAKLIYQKYDEMMALLRGYREKTFQDWVAGVDQDCHFNLGQPLIQRDHVTKLIRVNFSKALVAVLREVKYLNFQHQKGIPDSAESLFSKHETFRKFVGNLELVVGWYNEITTTVTDVEFPLIESELSAIDVKLQAAETTLFWNSEGVFDYIKEMREILHNLQNRMQKTKQNIENISQAMKDWSSNPMFERKDNKKDALLDLDGRLVTLNKRYTVVKDAGVKIQAMVAENAELFRADTTSQSWKDYVNYIDNMVLDEFDYFIQNSLNYLMNNMVMDESVAPLFEIRMELDEAGLVFNPSLEVGSDRSFLALVDGLINDIYNAAKLIPRLAKGRLNYKSDLEDLTDLIEMREEMSSLVVSAMKEAEEYQDSFERYSYLWTDDLQESMRTFLTYGRALTPEDLEMHAEEAIPKAPPTLAQFQQQIDSYERLYEEVSRCENTKVFSGWLQCDCRPFKQALLSTIKRWSFMFKRHLSSHVVSSLSDLETFMNVARTGLKKPLKEGDYDGLVEVMGHLMKVKERQAATDTMFEPLKQTIELLKTYGEEMPEETHTKLQELPEQWTNTKKLAIQVKQNVAPLQANEVNILRRKCQQFELKQHEFREKFRQEAPFSFNDPDPYRSLNKQQKSITAMESSMEALCKSGSLFEVTVPDYKQLKACHKEVLLLKELWDMIVLVNTSIDDWKTTKWKDINVEQMDIDCKKFAKDVRSLDKEMKAWDAFVGLDNTVKNMITSLRAVSELQNPAIRSRHWQQLMQATQVKFEMSEDTTLADLLQLNLHKYEDEVRNIVDKAVKESGMEKVLKALDSTWSTMEFEHEPHPRTGTMLLKSDEVLVETLEDNQVQLQNLMTSKYLSHFLKEVTSWQQKLSTADAVISIWFEVQRTWSHLESIFVGSEDIRAQLPEDSQRFDHIDLEFKALMADAVKTPNVVEATNKPGLYSKLEDLKKSLAVCEKALAEYLETKRLAFPRFYFVSSADLLDILSNGNDPVEVSRHLSKLFDSLCKLKFRLDANEKPLKFGLGMYSKEDEYMDFDRECDLSGQVLHNLDPVPPLDHGRSPRWPRGDRQDRDDQGPGPGPGHHGVRLQLLGADGLQVLRKHLQGPGPDGSLGLLRRVQPDLGGSLVRDRRAGEVCPGRHSGQEEDVQLPGGDDKPHSDRRHLYHHEPRVRGAHGAAREPKGPVQDHYDWGLRAIKSVLVVAGSLKRGDPSRAEDQVLMRALRDFNIPKIVTDDLPVFMGLIGDLFPALDVPRKRDLNFEKIIKQSILELRLQAEDSFVLKVVQLEELLHVRHSVFVIGNAGSGKSQVLKSLNKTYQNLKRKPVAVDLDPKAVTCDELFGIINPATREWKDGLFSTIMRDLANITHDGPKWIVLDGDIDPMWIESLNTVMDDNKVLTLASNERIPLNRTMRLVFEISHLRTATPATVSRAGILYINPADLGWNPVVSSWLERRKVQSEKANLMILFDKYLPMCLDKLRFGFKKITPVPEITIIHMVLYLLECLLTEKNTPADSPKELYELYFVFACFWAFGGAMFQDQLVDYRVEFSKWWINEFKTIKFPSQGTIFDYYLDPDTKKFLPWTDKVPSFELDPDIPLQASLVHTTETIRIRYFMDLLMAKSWPVMLVGNAGTGKSVLMGDKLESLNTDDYLVQAVPFNFYTTSAMLQGVLEKPLEKKSGRNYGPPGTKKLIYFIDDMNMPEVDKYGTVAPHTLIRQHMDHKHWYDRQKLTLKEVHNCQYVACMNPTSGSFTIDPRLQRHFCVFAVSFPGQEALTTIYSTILSQHLAYRSAPMVVQKMSNQLVASALALHQKVTATFLPTAIKFHYIFNLRDLSNIFQGLLFSTAEILRTPLDLVRLWLHEAERVYGDKMVDEKDQETLRRVTMASTKKFFDDLGDELLFARPNIFCHFAQGVGEAKYLPVTDVAHLNKLLVDVLDSYNEVNAVMNLVLFEDAVAHICRINRILEAPRGNALLVGVGGSGKQSLSRLAAYISSLEVFQITLKKGYAVLDLKADLSAQYIKSAVKNVPSVFLMTDSQVAEEQFLVLINDLLASGEIPGLFADDEVENIISSMRPQVKSIGMNDTRETCWKFFIEKVRRQLKVILCFSPVGSVLRVRARKFPAVVNCTAIDWFHEWPEDALVSVSARFLEETEGIQPEVKASISHFMAYVHTTVNEMSKVYLATERRYNYTTPKTFLEQIKLYQNLLAKKRTELVAKIERLENGLMKLQSTASQVDDLKAKLAIQEAELKQKNENADKLIQVVGVETEKVSKEKAIADEEEIKVEVINKNVAEKQKACETDLAKAEPALLAAQEALDTLNKNNLTELKSFGSPPDAVVNVTAAVMILTAPGGKIPKDKSWKAAKIMMGKVDTFLDSLKRFDKEHIPEACLKAFKPYQGNPTFDPEFVRSKSAAAAGLCSWCINIVRFYEVYCDVAPKRQALEEANAELAEAQEKLSRIKNKIAELNANLSNLTSAFEKATAEKIKCQQEADATNRVISLANRLVGGLASENVRWAESVENFRSQGVTLCGDVLLISAFVSYVGYFTKKYRNELMERFWIPYVNKLKVPIPITEGLDPLSLLTDDADVATWNNQGLPSDRMSTENATILCNTERWPLIVDAQLQGIKWIKNKYGSELKAIRLGQKSYLDIIERAISEGDILLIENIGETVDPVLDPLLGRNTIKKGKYIKIGDKEVEYHPKFRLIMHTKYFNPHYKPEMQAQCSLINFLVTRDGLEDQLLAAVVAKERPDLEQLKANLTKSQNEFKIVLKELEDSLLARLSAASGNFLGDTALVENLETTKHTASEIEEKVQEAKVTEVKINEARENYRPAAERASLLYFILNDLNKINPIYQFSLKAFHVVFEKAILKTSPADEVKQRVINLTDEITYSVYMYTARGLFERDKLIFLAQVAFQVLSMKKELNPAELDFLLRFPFKAGVLSPVDFLQHQGWGGIKALSEMDEFKNLDNDIEGSAKRWKKLVESEAPEKEIFPKEWKNKTALQKLCMVRCMRPDRMTYAVKNFVEEKMGSKFVEGRSVEFSKSYEESSPSTPIFFILSPGVDPLKDVEALGKKLGFTIDNGKLHNVSLGQGQEVVAENALDVAAENGHWVILQNIHLVARWLSTLDKKVERYSTGSHEDYRVFISAEPAPSPESHIIPQGILENAIKITNEPPTGMYANLHKALDLFTQDTLEMCTKEIEFKCILFALCYFHAVVAERRKFGAQGWNRSYPFNNGDLTISINVLYNYLEANAKVPWDDLRYLFGEIMYGGHITDDWDRRLCRTYLVEYIRAEMLEGEIQLAPGFQIPPNLDYKGYHEYIDENLPPESPYLYGLHPNAEIGFLTVTSEKLFRTVLEMQPKESDSGAGAGVSREEKVKAVLDEVLEKIPETFNMAEIMAKAAEKTPYVVVAFQECERMNILTNEMRRSLKELNLGLKGELTITTDMEDLSTALFYDTVPDTWVARAYPSMMGLAAWYADLLLRIRELEAWTTDFALPTTVWLAGFFNPQSFLTAIMQSMARKNEWPLDKMCLSVEVTKKTREDMTAPPREGSYVYGLFMEGQRALGHRNFQNCPAPLEERLALGGNRPCMP